MKMALTKKVIHSAFLNKLQSDYSYVAIPTNPKNIEKCKIHGIGIIRVNKNRIKVILKPKISNILNNYVKTRFIKNCKKCGTDGIGGLPMLKGQGPAIECSKRVIEYLKRNPKSTWKNIFKNVNNHYSNYKSMYNALSYMVTK